MLKKEYLFPLTVMAIGGLLFYQSFHLTSTMPQPMSSALYARIIIIFVELMGVIFIVSDMLKRSPAPKKKVVSAEDKTTSLQSLAIIVLSIAYGISFAYIGYCVTSFAFLFLLIWMLSRKTSKELVKALMISVIVTGLLFLCFQKFLNIYFMESLLF